MHIRSSDPFLSLLLHCISFDYFHECRSGVNPPAPHILFYKMQTAIIEMSGNKIKCKVGQKVNDIVKMIRDRERVIGGGLSDEDGVSLCLHVFLIYIALYQLIFSLTNSNYLYCSGG